MQKCNRDLAEIGEISPRLTKSGRDLGEICIVVEISPRSRRDKRDLAEITVRDLVEIELNLDENSARFVMSLRSRRDKRDLANTSARFVMSLRSRRDK